MRFLYKSIVSLFILFPFHTAAGSTCDDDSLSKYNNLENEALKTVGPRYPAEPSLRVTGKVAVKVVVHESGSVMTARFLCGHPLLAAPSVAASREWKFRPQRLRGPEGVRVGRVGIITFVFPVQSLDPAASPVCLNYEPSSATVHGLLKRQTFAGLKHSKKPAKKNQSEVYWVLHLDESICLNASGDWPEEKEIRGLQLVFTDQAQYKGYTPLLGRRVVITGTLFRAHTGHHHTKVLVTVSEIKKL